MALQSHYYGRWVFHFERTGWPKSSHKSSWDAQSAHSYRCLQLRNTTDTFFLDDVVGRKINVHNRRWLPYLCIKNQVQLAALIHALRDFDGKIWSRVDVQVFLRMSVTIVWFTDIYIDMGCLLLRLCLWKGVESCHVLGHWRGWFLNRIFVNADQLTFA